MPGANKAREADSESGRGKHMQFDRSSEFSHSLVEWVRGKGRILIVSHDNPDPDSLAAAVALKHLFLVKAGKEAVITFGGVIGRGENRAMVSELEIVTVPIDVLDLEQFDVFCMVDTQPGAGNNSFPSDLPVDVVIDHHPIQERTRDCRFVDIRERYGASATILLEYLLAQDIYIGIKLATILFYAIKSETQDLGREWSPADRDAYLHLIPLCNNQILFKIIHPKVSPEYFYQFNRALESSRIYGSVLIFNLFSIDQPDIVAEMADFLLRLEGVQTVFGIGYYQDRHILSMRTLDTELVAGKVIRTVVDGIGTAGGHDLIAGGQIRHVPSGLTSQRKIQKLLTSRLLDELGETSRRAKRLLPI